MDTYTPPKLIVIAGPTATGKSDLAVQIALHLKNEERINCEIISTDSRQIYKYLNLGTGKITEEEMKGIIHHGLDIVEPMDQYSVADYKIYAKHIIESILARNSVPILCGGTGQYIDYLIQDIELPDVKPNEILRATLDTKTTDELISIFHALNKDQIHHVDLKNKRKIIRAIEILESLGHIPEIKTNRPYKTLSIGLDMPDKLLRDKIKKRIDTRLRQGMIEESQSLLANNKITIPRMRQLGLEYEYIADLLEKNITEADFKDKLFFASWQYAKRQRTWFKRDKTIHWFNPLDANNQKDIIDTVVNFCKKG